MIEYILRDVLNLALGNRDKHGRNTALLKEIAGTLRLTALFDVGPSFLDERALVRSIRWIQNRPANDLIGQACSRI